MKKPATHSQKAYFAFFLMGASYLGVASLMLLSDDYSFYLLLWLLFAMTLPVHLLMLYGFVRGVYYTIKAKPTDMALILLAITSSQSLCFLITTYNCEDALPWPQSWLPIFPAFVVPFDTLTLVVILQGVLLILGQSVIWGKKLASIKKTKTQPQ